LTIESSSFLQDAMNNKAKSDKLRMIFNLFIIS